MPLNLIGGILIKWLGSTTLIALLLGAAGYFYHDWQSDRLENALQEITAERDALRVNRDDWRSSASAFERQAKRLADEHQAARAAVQALQATLAEREAAYTALRQRIEQAPATDDGPVAPVLRQALEALP